MLKEFQCLITVCVSLHFSKIHDRVILHHFSVPVLLILLLDHSEYWISSQWFSSWHFLITPFLSASHIRTFPHWPIPGWLGANNFLFQDSFDIFKAQGVQPQSLSSLSMGLPVWASTATSDPSKVNANTSCISSRKLGRFCYKIEFEILLYKLQTCSQRHKEI